MSFMDMFTDANKITKGVRAKSKSGKARKMAPTTPPSSRVEQGKDGFIASQANYNGSNVKPYNAYKLPSLSDMGVKD